LREAQEEIKRNKEIIDNLFIQKVQLFKELTKLNNKLEEDKKKTGLNKKNQGGVGKRDCEFIWLFYWTKQSRN